MGQAKKDTDVFVVGAGPAGLAAAIAARMEGFRVTVADCASGAVQDSCGEGLLPSGVAALRNLGVTLGLNDGIPFRGLRFAEKRIAAQADFPQGWGRGVRRSTLHKLLAERAWRVGVEMNWGVRVSCGQSGALYANGEEVRSRWIIGADGHNSRVRNWAGLGANFGGAKRYALRRHYRAKPWSDSAELHWSRECQMQVTPSGANDVCLTVLTANGEMKFDQALARFPELSARVAGAESAGAETSAICASRSGRTVFRGNLALVGDAAGGVDAISGDALSLALRQGICVAKALRTNDLCAYQREHHRMMQRPRMMARLLLQMSAHGWLRRRLLNALAANPAMFSRLLAAHAGTMNWRKLVLDYAPEFTWQILTGHDTSSSSEMRGSRYDER